MSSEAGPFWNPSKSARSAQGRLDLPDPDLCSLRPKVVPPSGLSLSPSCTSMNRPRTYMYDGNQSTFDTAALAAVLVRFGSIAMGYSNYTGGHFVFVLCRCVVLGPCTSLHWVPVRVLRARSRCSRRRCRRRRRVTMTGRVGDRVVKFGSQPSRVFRR